MLRDAEHEETEGLIAFKAQRIRRTTQSIQHTTQSAQNKAYGLGETRSGRYGARCLPPTVSDSTPLPCVPVPLACSPDAARPRELLTTSSRMRMINVEGGTRRSWRTDSTYGADTRRRDTRVTHTCCWACGATRPVGRSGGHRQSSLTVAARSSCHQRCCLSKCRAQGGRRGW